MTTKKPVILDYKIIESNSSVEISLKVKQYLNQGWSLSGGISISVSNGVTKYAQSIVKLA